MPVIIYTLPAFNEGECLGPLLESISEVAAQSPGHDIKVIVVDDGSRDNTAGVARKHEAQLPLTLIQHPQNQGLRAAMMTGFRAALERAAHPDDIIICMDADNTHHPRYAIQMARLVIAGEADIVIASRYQRGSKQVGVPFMRQVYSYGAHWLFKLFLNLPGVRDYTCGYRAYRAGLMRRAMDDYGDGLITRGGFACNDELICHLAAYNPRVREIPFILRYDLKKGESKLQLGTTISETLKMLIEQRRELKSRRK